MKLEASTWMPFFGDAFFGSERVAVMDDSAKVLYLRCLWRQWAHGPLPSDEQVLRRMFPDHAAEWRRVWPQVVQMFTLTPDGRLVNETLAAHRREADAIVSRARRGAEVANAKRKQPASDPQAQRERSASDSLATRERNASEAQAPRERALVTVTDTETEENQSPPSPLAGGANAATDSGNEPPGPQPEPRRQRPRRKPAEPWADVLERPEFAPLRESEPFVFGWKTWVEHCQTQGSKAREPGGPRAVAMFNEALRVGPAKYAAALDQAIAANWQAPHVAALERDSASRAGPIPNVAQRNFDSLREQAARLFGSESA